MTLSPRSILAKSKFVFPLLFLLMLFGAVSYDIRSKKRILVIHSYSTNYAWVNDINVGLDRGFKDIENTLIKYHYMDTKRFPDPRSKEKASINAVAEINRWKPDVVITIDDDAQFLVGTKFIDHPDIDVVYAGIQNSSEGYGYTAASNVTGIREDVVLRPLFETISQSKGVDQEDQAKLRIYHLSDTSSYSASVVNRVRSFKWAPHELVSSQEYVFFEDWKKGILEANDSADLIYLTNYHTLKQSPGPGSAGEDVTLPSVPSKEVMRWALANSDLPIVGSWSFLVQDGGMLSMAMSGYEQGEVAATLARLAASGEQLPIEQRHVTNQQVLVVLREKAIERYRWKLPDLYTSFARATGNYYE